MGSLLPGWDQPSPTSPPPPKFNWSVDRAGKSRSSLDVEVDGTNNVVDEVDLVTGCVGAAEGIGDPFANAFGPVKVS